MSIEKVKTWINNKNPAFAVLRKRRIDKQIAIVRRLKDDATFSLDTPYFNKGVFFIKSFEQNLRDVVIRSANNEFEGLKTTTVHIDDL
jgi:hypothetical protein